ncbi:hypothetical protein [Flagellimonas algicola]|uniref:Uncharacterized protein n=1 Tax=Flagellimonas algicola TaxID=2583815 RepID=A0ABY2WHV3_9FLAO|nr:hypothetical protein [Allomuricauda algicola]TMU50745.1 hypothetical protein FGG15_18270 [Allomuricauda algicola]
MTYLKIDNNKGYYRTDGSSEEWTELDQISKDDLLKLIGKATTEEFQMQEYKDELLQNPAHNIIYRNIYGKFNEFLSNKTRFQDSVNAMYKTAIDKYTVELSTKSEEENASE